MSLVVAQFHQRRPALCGEAGEFDQVAAAGAFRIDDGVQADIEWLWEGMALLWTAAPSKDKKNDKPALRAGLT